MIYRNEWDAYAAAWLANLIAAGHIPDGEVDTRSVTEVRSDQLAGFTQHHFFAGIGGWELALKMAGWPQSRKVWTASCPCQPFSSAGAQEGFNDERHLWPHIHRLVRECRPPVIFGEQVASKIAEPWIELVRADLEALAYRFAAIAFPSAGVGAPHIRDRVYWVGYADHARLEGHAWDGGTARWARPGRPAAPAGLFDRVANADPQRVRAERLGQAGRSAEGMCRKDGERQRFWADVRAGGAAFDRLANLPGVGRIETGNGQSSTGSHGVAGDRAVDGAGPVNGFWRAADWLWCRDNKWRPVEPGSFPLAHGVPARVGRLRAYGNAINPVQAAEFITAVMEWLA